MTNIMCIGGPFHGQMRSRFGWDTSQQDSSGDYNFRKIDDIEVWLHEEEGVQALLRHYVYPSGDFSIGGTLWPGLSKVVEETGELNTELGKLIGSEGNPQHWTGDLIPRIVDEGADVVAAVFFFLDINRDKLDKKAFGARVTSKYSIFHRWHQDTLKEKGRG